MALVDVERITEAGETRLTEDSSTRLLEQQEDDGLGGGGDTGRPTVSDPVPYPEPPPPVWTWVLGSTAGVERRELTQAVGRRVTWRLDGPADAQFSIDGRSDEAAEVVEFATDLTIYRDGTLVFRGRIGTEVDDIDATVHRCQFSAIDYRGLLDRRIVGAAGVSYVGIDQGAIAWDLINDSQALSGGSWGITQGVGSTSGTTRDRTYDPGKPIGEAISELFRVDGGGEWQISPTLELDRWYPTRGADNGVVLDYGGLITRVARQNSPADFANFVLVTGSDATIPADEVTAGIGTDPRGRWESSFGYPSIIEQATLDGRAVWARDQTSTPKAALSMTFAAGRWGGPSHVWLGDTVYPAVRSGRLSIAGTAYRVAELSVSPGEDGTETVTVGLVQAP